MTVTISDLTFEAILGILEHERHTPQRIIVDCVLTYTFERTFVNYAEVAEMIKQTMRDEKFELIEEAIEALMKRLSAHFPAIETLSLTITKPDILPDCRVSASLERKFKKN